MRRTIASPRPAPPVSAARAGSTRWKRSKTRSASADGIPTPWSSTTILASPPARSSETAISVEPEWRTAFAIRFASASPTSCASQSATHGPSAAHVHG